MDQIKDCSNIISLTISIRVLTHFVFLLLIPLNSAEPVRKEGNQILFSPHFRPLQSHSRDNWQRMRRRGERGLAGLGMAWGPADRPEDSIPAHFYAFINLSFGPNN